MKFSVGDEVVVTDVNWRGETRRSRVVRTGRKYVYVDGDVGKFDASTGVIEDAYKHRSIYTLTEWSERQRLAVAHRMLREFGVELRSGMAGPKVLDIYAAILPLMSVPKP